MQWLKPVRGWPSAGTPARTALAVLLVVFAVSACRQVPRTGAEGTSEESPAPSAPAFDLKGLDGARYTLEDYSGKVLLVEFWATWCGPCRLQAEILSRLWEEVRGQNVEFLAVSLGESEEIVREYVLRDPFPYPVVVDPEETLGYALEVYALPTLLIVGPQGRVRFLRPGITDAGTLQRELAGASS